MDRVPKFPAQQLAERMRGEFDQLMTQVAQSVNDAPQGRVIVDSEERVRDLMGEFRRSTYQNALQLGVDAAEAAFFPRLADWQRTVGEPMPSSSRPGQRPRQALGCGQCPPCRIPNRL